MGNGGPGGTAGGRTAAGRAGCAGPVPGGRPEGAGPRLGRPGPLTYS